MLMYRFQISKNVDCSKLCKKWNNFGEHNEKYVLEGPFGECIFIDSKTRQGFQFGYNGLMMDMMSEDVIERVW